MEKKVTDNDRHVTGVTGRDKDVGRVKLTVTLAWQL